jgi:hypothetical protein
MPSVQTGLCLPNLNQGSQKRCGERALQVPRVRCASAIFPRSLRSSPASRACPLCARWALGVDPMELLRMINGRSLPTTAIVVGLAREKLAEEIRNDLAVK